MSWTPEREEKLKELWKKGHSGSQIANILGNTTRNAVIGKANRLGLPKHPSRLEDNEEITYEENNNVEELYQPKICSHSTCSMTAQPGREYCAFHCRLIIEEQKKEKQAS